MSRRLRSGAFGRLSRFPYAAIGDCITEHLESKRRQRIRNRAPFRRLSARSRPRPHQLRTRPRRRKGGAANSGGGSRSFVSLLGAGAGGIIGMWTPSIAVASQTATRSPSTSSNAPSAFQWRIKSSNNPPTRPPQSNPTGTTNDGNYASPVAPDRPSPTSHLTTAGTRAPAVSAASLLAPRVLRVHPPRVAHVWGSITAPRMGYGRHPPRSPVLALSLERPVRRSVFPLPDSGRCANPRTPARQAASQPQSLWRLGPRARRIEVWSELLVGMTPVSQPQLCGVVDRSEVEKSWASFTSRLAERRTAWPTTRGVPKPRAAGVTSSTSGGNANLEVARIAADNGISRAQADLILTQQEEDEYNADSVWAWKAMGYCAVGILVLAFPWVGIPLVVLWIWVRHRLKQTTEDQQSAYQQPTVYQPGDIVNGHQLNESGTRMGPPLPSPPVNRPRFDAASF